MGKKGFTLVELVTVVALISVALLFWAKFQLMVPRGDRQNKVGAQVLVSALAMARSQAIAKDQSVAVGIDISSVQAYRRLFQIRQTDEGKEFIEKEFLLPEGVYILSKENLSSQLEGCDLSAYELRQSYITLRGEQVFVLLLTFDSRGVLINEKGENTTAMVGVGCGRKDGCEIVFDKQEDLCGVFVTAMGKAVMLTGKNAMMGALGLTKKAEEVE